MDDFRNWLEGIYGDLFDAVDRGAVPPEARLHARGADPAFRQADDDWQAFMNTLRARRAVVQQPPAGMIPGGIPGVDGRRVPNPSPAMLPYPFSSGVRG